MGGRGSAGKSGGGAMTFKTTREADGSGTITATQKGPPGTAPKVVAQVTWSPGGQPSDVSWRVWPRPKGAVNAAGRLREMARKAAAGG
jgi:hypothetical protein